MRRLGVAQPSDGRWLQVGAEIAHDPVVGEDQRERQHDGDGEAQEKFETGMTKIQIGPEMGLGAGGSVNLQQQIPSDCSDEYADGKTSHANTRG